MNDPRQNKPSASGIARLAACPRSHLMQIGHPDTSTPESESGTRIHAVLAKQASPDTLTPEELDIAESCHQIEVALFAQWKLRHGFPDDAVIHVVRDAERLWYGDECSGLADVVYVCDGNALILDFKTGRVATDDGAENLQLRCLAVLVFVNYETVLTIDVAAIQPLVTHTPEVCQYTAQDLDAARVELDNILDAAKKPDAPLVTGDHCKYCRANTVCPKVREDVERMALTTVQGASLTLSDADLAAFLPKCGQAIKMAESIKAEAKRRCEANPELWRDLGYEMKEGAGRRTVSDVATVGERLNIAGASWREITEACTVTIGNVEALTRKATGKKGKELNAAVAGILEGCVSLKQAAPSLKRIGETEE